MVIWRRLLQSINDFASVGLMEVDFADIVGERLCADDSNVGFGRGLHSRCD